MLAGPVCVFVRLSIEFVRLSSGAAQAHNAQAKQNEKAGAATYSFLHVRTCTPKVRTLQTVTCVRVRAVVCVRVAMVVAAGALVVAAGGAASAAGALMTADWGGCVAGGAAAAAGARAAQRRRLRH
jgi:hypothetical protein